MKRGKFAAYGHLDYDKIRKGLLEMERDSSGSIQPGRIRMAEVLAAFSLATDLGIGRPMEHALRACYCGLHIARQMNLSQQEQAELYYTILLMHSGCAVDASNFAAQIQGDEISSQGDLSLRDTRSAPDMLGWMVHNVAPSAAPLTRLKRVMAFAVQGPGLVNLRLAGFCEVASRIASRLGMPDGVVRALSNIYETWDGKGPFGVQGQAIPLPARIVSAVFQLEPYIRLRGFSAAEQFATAHSGKVFDPEVIRAFLAAIRQPGVKEDLQKEELWQIVLDIEPDSTWRYIPEERIEDVAQAFADALDLKSPATVDHSRETARLAERIALRLGLGPTEIACIRRAALVHDMGKVVVPAAILEKSAPLNPAERERMQLHPYYTERILAWVPALREAAAMAGAHHERLDGSGYFRGLSGSQISPGARILAMADEFDEHSRLQAGPGEKRIEAVLQIIKPEVGPRLDPVVYEALTLELGLAASGRIARRDLPAGLTEREVEVLRWLAKGASNRQIARELSISDKTAGHHLEHIYNKIGVSSRAAAVFFAVENELI
jgi:HD-GYP domain-containing protein (c-di-GMP phosphodiesterase class II)